MNNRNDFNISNNLSFFNENMMGPNSVLMLEELLCNINLKPGMKILDLGCGKGLTSIFLAKKYNVNVFAVDLWIKAEENFERFKNLNVDDLVVSINSDAMNLPFSKNYFDAVISIDSYHYFGNNDIYFNKFLRPLLKKDALVIIAFPGMKYEVHKNIPEEMKKFWNEEALEMWHSIDWWKPKFSNYLNNFVIKELNCFDEAWNDWLKSDNEYAIDDKLMIEIDNGKYMNLIGITGKNI